MQEVLSLVRRVAPSDATVLIRGESGTGQGADRQGDPLREPAGRRAARQGQLRRPRREPARGRAVRPREGRLHRRHRHPQGAVRAGRRRQPLPRRDRRSARPPAGEAAAGSPGAGVRAGGIEPADHGRRAPPRRDASRPGGPGAGGSLPRGPLLPHQRGDRSRCRRSASGARTCRSLIDHFVRTFAAKNGKTDRGTDPGGARGPAPLRLSGQRSRAREPDRAGGGADARRRDRRWRICR